MRADVAADQSARWRSLALALGICLGAAVFASQAQGALRRKTASSTARRSSNTRRADQLDPGSRPPRRADIRMSTSTSRSGPSWRRKTRRAPRTATASRIGVVNTPGGLHRQPARDAAVLESRLRRSANAHRTPRSAGSNVGIELHGGLSRQGRRLQRLRPQREFPALQHHPAARTGRPARVPGAALRLPVLHRPQRPHRRRLRARRHGSPGSRRPSRCASSTSTCGGFRRRRSMTTQRYPIRRRRPGPAAGQIERSGSPLPQQPDHLLGPLKAPSRRSPTTASRPRKRSPGRRRPAATCSASTRRCRHRPRPPKRTPPPGVDMDLQVPQAPSPVAPSDSEIRGLTVTFPEGFSINPNAADGKVSCPDAAAKFGSEDGSRMPPVLEGRKRDAAQLGPSRAAAGVDLPRRSAARRALPPLPHRQRLRDPHQAPRGGAAGSADRAPDDRLRKPSASRR